MKAISGDVQYQFKATTEHKERNYCNAFIGWMKLIKLVIKAVQKRPDKIYIFFKK